MRGARPTFLVLLATVGPRAAHRLRERGQPDPGPPARAQPRAGHALRARRGPRAPAAPAPDREHDPGPGRRGARASLLAFAARGLLTTFAARFTPRAGEVQIDGAVLLFTLVTSVLTGHPGRRAARPARARAASRETLVGGERPQHGRPAQAPDAHRPRGLAARPVLRAPHRRRARCCAASQNLRQRGRRLPRRARALRAREPQLLDLRDAERRIDAEQGRGLQPLDGGPDPPSARAWSPSARAWTFPLNNHVPQRRDLPRSRGAGDGTGPPPKGTFIGVSPSYFETLGVPVLRGRAFEDRDRDGRRAARSSSTSAWPGGTGRTTIRSGAASPATAAGPGAPSSAWWATCARQALDEESDRHRVPALPRVPGLRATPCSCGPSTIPRTPRRRCARPAAAPIPQAAVTDVRTLDDIRSEALSSPRLTTVLLGLFAVLALVITAAGLSGLIAYSVSQRTQEIGIRMALGADRGRITTMILREGMTSVAVGLGARDRGRARPVAAGVGPALRRRAHRRSATPAPRSCWSRRRPPPASCPRGAPPRSAR